jgi:ribose 5-phosphate isomerase A
MNLKKIEIAKKAAAEAAIAFIKPGMTLGLGTGSTATYFIEALGNEVSKGLSIFAVATSINSFELAKQLNIKMIDIDFVTSLDVVVDGADEIDQDNHMIKGGGAALFREKIVAHMSHEMIVIVDESKVVDYLGNFKLPIEITPFGYRATMHKLQKFGMDLSIRNGKNDAPLITENGNYIVDLKINYPCKNPEKLNVNIRAIPGVCETGLFINMAKRVIIGYEDGHVQIR